MKITKVLALFLALVMLFGAVACTRKDPEDSNADNITGTNPDEPEAPVIIPDKVVDLKTFLNAMASSAYKLTDTVTDAKIGLSDSKNVGVDKDRFENEILYPVPADSEFAHIYKVSEHGISTDSENNSRDLNALLKSLKTVEGLKKVEFEPGAYKFASTIVFEDLKDVYFCSSDPAKNFEILMTNWTQAISVNDSDNIHFNNFDLDYENSPTVAGEIVAYDEKTLTVTLKIFDEFDLTAKEYNGGKLGHAWASYIEFVVDPNSGEYIPDNTGNIRTGNELVSGSYNADTHEMTIVFSSSARYPDRVPKIGERASIAFTMSDHHGFNGANCGKIYMENVNIYTTCGMAIGLSCSDGFYLNRLKLDLREGSTRLMTATADGFHTEDIGEIKITNSVFQYSHDDALNVKNSFVYVTGGAGKVITIRAGKNFDIAVDDTVEVFNEKTMESYGKYTVKKLENKPGSTIAVTVDKIISNDNLNDCIFANLSAATKLTFDNNVIGNKRNRGLLLQSRESTITNNTWKNMIHCAVVVFTERYSFVEGICPANVTIANNKFIGNYEGDIAVDICGSLGPHNGGIPMSAIEGIEINNNFFANTPVASLNISSCTDSSVSNNLFYNTSCADNVMYGMHVDHSENVKFNNNRIYSTVKSKLMILETDNKSKNIENTANKFEKLD